MVCSECGGKLLVVDNVNTPNNEIYRKKKCKECKSFTWTIEKEVTPDPQFKFNYCINHRQRNRKKN